MYDRVPASEAERSHLALFDRRIDDVDAFLLSHDLIWVGGGNTASMLAVWRVHGVDRALRRAWDAGVVLCGGSAGSLCWFEGGTAGSSRPGSRRAGSAQTERPANRGDAAVRRRRARPGRHGERGRLPPGQARRARAGARAVRARAHARLVARALAHHSTGLLR